MKKIIATIVALVVLVPVVAFAADFRTNKDSGNIEVNATEHIGNLYAAGSNIDIKAKTLGDIVAAGNSLYVRGDVAQSVMLAGANINIESNIEQNMRVVGADINLLGNVGQDALLAGSTINLDKNSTVSGDLFAAANSVNIDGIVNGNVKTAGGHIIINGKINSDVTIKGAQSVTLGDGAYISGKLKYEAPTQASISSSAQVVGGVDYVPTKVADYRALAGFVALATVAKWVSILSSLLLAIIIAYALSKFVNYVFGKVYKKPWTMFLWGFIALVVVPISALILLASVLGSSLGMLIGATYSIALLFAKPLGALILGSWIVRLFSKDKTPRADWLTALVGVFVSALLGMLPFIGWIIPFFCYMLAFGALVEWTLGWIKRNR